MPRSAAPGQRRRSRGADPDRTVVRARRRAGQVRSGATAADTATDTWRAVPLPTEVDVLVVGAGQAGLGTAYWLGREPGTTVLVLDGAPVGQTWLDRWDSLVLFTPRRFSGLPGLAFPRGRSRCPTRTEMADYLRAYVRRFDLTVATGARVTFTTRFRAAEE